MHTDRAGKVFGFDASGELTVAQELGTFKGNWSTSTAFAVRDIIKDTSNNNVYICLTAHTSSGSQPISTNTDVAKWGLLVDAASATSSASAAAASASCRCYFREQCCYIRTNASTSEANAAATSGSASFYSIMLLLSATAQLILLQHLLQVLLLPKLHLIYLTILILVQKLVIQQ